MYVLEAQLSIERKHVHSITGAMFLSLKLYYYSGLSIKSKMLLLKQNVSL
jgi:hypothetical protein